MISMDTKQEIIRRYFRENDHIRKIARDLRISRQSVRLIFYSCAALQIYNYLVI